MADTLKCNCKLNGAAYLAKPHTNIHAGAGGRSQGASLPSPHTCLGYLLIRSLSRRIHASMAQLLPMARAWLPCHQRGLRDRNQKQFRKEARRFSKCKRLLCCAGAGHQGRAACGSLHLPPGGTLLPGAQIIPTPSSGHQLSLCTAPQALGCPWDSPSEGPRKSCPTMDSEDPQAPDGVLRPWPPAVWILISPQHHHIHTPRLPFLPDTLNSI